MGFVLVLAFIVIPILEIIVFIQAGQLIGLWPTVAGVVLTAVIGAALVRHQGLSTIASAQRSLNEGRFPVEEVFDGLCLVLAGAFLITPGFVTDTVGFLLLVPPLRAALRHGLARHMVASGRVTMWADGPEPAPGPSSRPSSGPSSRPGAGRDGGPVVIDGEYEDVSDTAGSRPADSTQDPRSDAADDREQQDRDSPWRLRDGP